MIKKIFYALFPVLLFCAIFGHVSAQEGWKEEAILDFHADIQVNEDNSMDVTETIRYDSGSWEKHGIYRNISTLSSQNRKMEIRDISVRGPDGSEYTFDVWSTDKDVWIKIGDEDITFTGEKIYIIHYRATNAVAQYENFDEIYWNITGHEWKMPIRQASTTIHLPPGASGVQTACYFGVTGSTNKCEVPVATDGEFVFRSPVILDPGEEITAAVGFSKGYVLPYTSKDDMSNFFALYGAIVLAGIPPLVTFWVCFVYWRKHGRDQKGKGVIVPQYEILDGLTPMETAGILNQKVKAKDISAEIIYLATQGYLKLNQMENRTLGIFKTTDYELLKTKDSELLVNDFDKKLLNSIFKKGESVMLSDLKNKFYRDVGEITKLSMSSLLAKGYYSAVGGMQLGKYWPILIYGWFIPYLGGQAFGALGFWLPISIFISVFIFLIFYHLSPAKTQKGAEAREYILGLKDYLSIAEKDRLLFHNAPEKKPEVFEKLLPYAMVLGVADIWAKEFEDIYMTPPNWYGGPNPGAFSAVDFNRSLKNFSSASLAAASAPSGSGSGGGGSSGGGGGGGGGGSW